MRPPPPVEETCKTHRRTGISYREKAVLGRALRPEEAREFTAIARRIAALLALGSELDASYHAAAAASPSPLKGSG